MDFYIIIPIEETLTITKSMLLKNKDAHGTQQLITLMEALLRHLAPSDFHLFLHLKSFLPGRRLHDNEVKETVTTCFASQAAWLYDEGIQKLVQRYDKCLNNGGNYVEK